MHRRPKCTWMFPVPTDGGRRRDNAIISSRQGSKSRIAIERAEYSASIVDVAISPCNFEHQRTGQFATQIANPVLDLTHEGSNLSSCCHRPAKSASRKQSMSRFSDGLNTRPSPTVPFQVSPNPLQCLLIRIPRIVCESRS
jgi:hypothetical protein